MLFEFGSVELYMEGSLSEMKLINKSELGELRREWEKDILSGDEEPGIISKVGSLMESLIDLRALVSQELIKLKGDVGEVSESSLLIKGELNDSVSVRDCFLGDCASQDDDDEDEESVDPLEVLICLREGRLGNAI